MENPPASADCPFCDLSNESIVHSSNYGFVIRDNYPVTEGHLLVIPTSHVTSIFDLDEDAQQGMWTLVAAARKESFALPGVEAVNIGINDGELAGQTVPHAHIHVIPRRDGDVADPRGGIRSVIRDKARYWKE